MLLLSIRWTAWKDLQADGVLVIWCSITVQDLEDASSSSLTYIGQ